MTDRETPSASGRPTGTGPSPGGRPLPATGVHILVRTVLEIGVLAGQVLPLHVKGVRAGIIGPPPLSSGGARRGLPIPWIALRAGVLIRAPLLRGGAAHHTREFLARHTIMEGRGAPLAPHPWHFVFVHHGACPVPPHKLSVAVIKSRNADD